MFEMFESHLWLIGIPFWLAYCLFLRWRIQTNLGDDLFARQKATRAARWVFLVMAIPSLCTALLQYLGGFNRSTFYVYQELTNPYVLATWIVWWAWWLLAAWWLWFGRATNTIMDYQPVFRPFTLTPHRVRAAGSIVLLVVATTNILAMTGHW